MIIADLDDLDVKFGLLGRNDSALLWRKSALPIGDWSIGAPLTFGTSVMCGLSENCIICINLTICWISVIKGPWSNDSRALWKESQAECCFDSLAEKLEWISGIFEQVSNLTFTVTVHNDTKYTLLYATIILFWKINHFIQ